MSNLNQSASNLTQPQLMIDRDAQNKVILFVTPCVVFLYVNGVMLFTLKKKTIFQQTSRYILFGHMLWVDTFCLFMGVLLYVFAVSRIVIMKNVCLFLLIAASSLNQVSILNLSLMSLERYVAICFPLRHVELTNFERTHIGISVVWIMGFIPALPEMIIFFSIDTTNIAIHLFCSRINIFRLQVYKQFDIAFTCLFFVFVCFVIIFTYASIAAVAKSASSDKTSAKKANQTILLHLIQLCLCAVSILNRVIQEAIYVYTDYLTAVNVMMFCFLMFVIFPKCLSPLIYGLRDQAFSFLFKQYFTFGKIKISPVFTEQQI